MRRILPAALAALFGALPVVADAGTLEQTFRLEGDDVRAQRYERSTVGSLFIEPDGRVTEVEIDLPAGQRATYRTLLGRWRLDPVVRNGEAVRAKAHFEIDLYALRIPEQPRKMRFGVENVTFVDPPVDSEPSMRRSLLSPPRYPPSLAMEGTGARVMLLLRLDDTGRVVDAAAHDVDIYAHRISSARVVGPKSERFVANAVDAARDWVITDAAALEAGSVFVPVAFLPPGTGPGSWQPVLDVRASQLPWMQAIERGAIAMTAGGQGEAMDFRLRSSLDDTLLN